MKNIVYNAENNILNYTIKTGLVLLNNPMYINLCINNISSDSLSSINSLNTGFILPWTQFNFGDVCYWNEKNYNMSLQTDNLKISWLDICLKDDQNLTFDNNGSNWSAIFEYE